jgi:polyphosphate kinase 2 (PPK2 family)
MIGIFNRSHYEDVLVARVHGLVSGDRIEARYGQINAFERHLAENDVTILKFYLHISKKEQKARLQARLDDPTKRWKFNPDDLAERKHWHDYIAAYRIALERCSTEWAPWFIVPADRKWYRNAVVARILRSTLEALGYLSARPAGPRQDTNRVAARPRLSRMRRINGRRQQGRPIPGFARAGGRRGNLRRIPWPTH